MNAATTHGPARRLRRVTLVAVGVSVLFAATALAVNGNSITVQKPSNARVGVAYPIKASGYGVGRKYVYAFLDYQNCLATPAGEHRRGANGYIWAVYGAYAVKTNGHTPQAGPDHICAYLVKWGEPKNPSTGVVAHDFVAFTVH